MRLIKNIYALFLLFALPALTEAQTISGVVNSNDGPVIGATVSAGSNQGTITDLDGRYTFSLSPGTYKITYSYIGYVSQSQNVTLTAGETRNINVSLAEDVTQLGAVIVVGSRTQPRSDIDT
ncbi:MAG: carboxypeptidase-like regulatory domain-containing protein, partial [Cyclobacteriaceae bacterium]